MITRSFCSGPLFLLQTGNVCVEDLLRRRHHARRNPIERTDRTLERPSHVSATVTLNADLDHATSDRAALWSIDTRTAVRCPKKLRQDVFGVESFLQRQPLELLEGTGSGGADAPDRHPQQSADLFIAEGRLVAEQPQKRLRARR